MVTKCGENLKRKNLMWIPFALLFLSIIAITQLRVSESTTTTIVYVHKYPSEVYTVPDVDQTFTINISIQDVTNLYGFEIKMVYNTVELNATKVQVLKSSGDFFAPSDPLKIFVVKEEVNDNFNGTHGYVWVSVTLLSPELPKTGSGILATITFNSTSLGDSLLSLGVPNPVGTPPAAYTKLSNNIPAAITHISSGCTVTVLPEFPVALIVPLFMAITLVAIALKKHSMRKRIIQRFP